MKKGRKRYTRTIFFDHNTEKWTSFYVNNNGKIVVDRKKKYLKDVKSYLKNDQYNKVTKKESYGYKTILNERKIQSRVDYLLRKKKLTDLDKNILRNYGDSYTYKNSLIDKKLKRKELYDTRNTLIYFFDAIICKKTSAYFQTYIKQFNLFKELFLRNRMDNFKRYAITLEFNNMQLDGFTGKGFYKTINTFTNTMSTIVDENFMYKKVEWIRVRVKIIFKGMI